MAFAFGLLILSWLSRQPATPAAAATSLDYNTFKTQVQPIFLAKRAAVAPLT